ncbi:MAG: hypothetical protein R3A47_02910 [Polyangiales bacterium]
MYAEKLSNTPIRKHFFRRREASVYAGPLRSLPSESRKEHGGRLPTIPGVVDRICRSDAGFKIVAIVYSTHAA